MDDVRGVRAGGRRIDGVFRRMAAPLVAAATVCATYGFAAADEAPGAAVSTLSPPLHDLSPWSMFLNADIVVKTVMIGLAVASLTTWTVWLAKGVALLSAKRRARRTIRLLTQTDGLSEAARTIEGGRTRRGPVAALARAALREKERSAGLSSDGVKERVAIALSRIEARAGRDMAKGAGLLATIGATAPFVGLLGTVWGIMNSFVGISRAHTTNLAVVAPGIAEALLATAIGLVAAIPAVVLYNVFARSIGAYRAQLADASSEVMQRLSLDLDRGEQARRGGETVSFAAQAGRPHPVAALLRPAE